MSVNEQYEDMAKRRGDWKVGFKVEVWRSKGSGVGGRRLEGKGQRSEVRGQRSEGGEMDKRLEEIREEEAEFKQWFEDKEGLS